MLSSDLTIFMPPTDPSGNTIACSLTTPWILARIASPVYPGFTSWTNRGALTPLPGRYPLPPRPPFHPGPSPLGPLPGPRPDPSPDPWRPPRPGPSESSAVGVSVVITPGNSRMPAVVGTAGRSNGSGVDGLSSGAIVDGGFVGMATASTPGRCIGRAGAGELFPLPAPPSPGWEAGAIHVMCGAFSATIVGFVRSVVTRVATIATRTSAIAWTRTETINALPTGVLPACSRPQSAASRRAFGPLRGSCPIMCVRTAEQGCWSAVRPFPFSLLPFIYFLS